MTTRLVNGSAATLAGRLGIGRQKVNDHLRTLETHGPVRQVDQRRWGGLTERLLVATAPSYVVSPAALGAVAADPGRRRRPDRQPDLEPDRLSARYLVALAARLVREVGDLVHRSDEAGKRLATLALDTEIGLRDAAERSAFAAELTQAVTPRTTQPDETGGLAVS